MQKRSRTALESIDRRMGFCGKAKQMLTDLQRHRNACQRPRSASNVHTSVLAEPIRLTAYQRPRIANNTHTSVLAAPINSIPASTQRQ